MYSCDAGLGEGRIDIMEILIVDDHGLFRQGLAILLSDLFVDVNITETESADRAIELVGEGSYFDLVLFDLTMPGMNGFEGLRLLRELMPEVPVVIVSASDNRTDILTAFRHGAKGFIVKSSTAEVLEHALEMVLAGEFYVPMTVLGCAAMHLLKLPPVENA